VAPLPGMQVPGAHAAQPVELVPDAKVPLAQGAHAVDSEAPGRALNVPLGHAVTIQVPAHQ
jgi:hypothetical protein